MIGSGYVNDTNMDKHLERVKDGTRTLEYADNKSIAPECPKAPWKVISKFLEYFIYCGVLLSPCLETINMMGEPSGKVLRVSSVAYLPLG